MIVIAIIGILAAIAIPQFTAYRLRGYNATAKSDLKNAYTASQTYFGDKPDRNC
jgi:type IV pilus assembly protein PilA